MRLAHTPRSRVRRALTLSAIAITIALVASSCTAVMKARIDDLRTSVGQPALPLSALLGTAATTHTQAMCDARSVSHAPAGSYNQETATAVHELVGAAPLDGSITAQTDRYLAAQDSIWAQWQSDPELVDPKWTDMGIGEITCPDSNLYMTAVLREGPSMPTTGLYSTAQYSAAQIQVFSGVQYTTAPDSSGVIRPVLLDLYEPPASAPTPRPTVVEVHAGAFVGGSRTDDDGDALQWAERGFVGVTIDYRLATPDQVAGPGEITVAAAATLDAQQSVRWLRANAATYGIDTTRIAMIGHSAGGALSLGTAVSGSATTTGPLAGYSPAIEGALSAGAFLTPALPLLTLTNSEPAVMMFQYDYDDATHVTAGYAFETCDALRDAGSTCDEVQLAGTGHDSQLAPSGPWWTSKVGPFLWNHLDLADAVPHGAATS